MTKRFCILAIFWTILIGSSCVIQACRDIGDGMADSTNSDVASDLEHEDSAPTRETGEAGDHRDTPAPPDLDANGCPVSEHGLKTTAIAVNPAEVKFNGKLLGEVATFPIEISPAGNQPLEIYEVKWGPGTSTDFAIDTANRPPPKPGKPMVLCPGQGVILNITFTPTTVNPTLDDGGIELDKGALHIMSNATDEPLVIPVSGAGVDHACPTAVITCSQGNEVLPQTVLHLAADESYAPTGTIQKWQWDAQQPAGSQSVFVPSSSFPNPTFEANVQGLYTIYLTVYDQTGTPSCFPAKYEVVVISDEAIRVELTWHTPADADETNTGPQAGSDLNLHFKHPWAAGPDLDGDGYPDGWFDIPFDCFWFNAHPNWGSYDPAVNDDPGLDRDDTDGAGPENVDIDSPEMATTYCVGVHYWNDHGYGAAYATVRIYVYAQLIFEVADVMLEDLDMWEVACIDWPSSKTTLITTDAGEYKITPNYANPYFFQ